MPVRYEVYKSPSQDIVILEPKSEYNHKELFDLLTEIRLYWKEERQERVTEERVEAFAKKVGDFRHKVLVLTGVTTSGDFTQLVLENPNGYVSVMGNAINILSVLDKIVASFIDPKTILPYIYGWEYKIIK